MIQPAIARSRHITVAGHVTGWVGSLMVIVLTPATILLAASPPVATPPSFGSSGPVSLSFTPAGDFLAAAGGRLILIMDPASRKERLRLRPASDVQLVTFSPDGALLASAGTDNRVHLWDVGKGAERRNFERPEGKLLALTFLDAGTKLAAAGQRGTIHIWDVATGALRNVRFTQNEVAAATFSPGGSLLAFLQNETAVHLWDVKRGVRVQVLKSDPRPGMFAASLAFSGDGDRIALGARSVSLWDIVTGTQLTELDPAQLSLGAIAISPVGNLLAAAANNPGSAGGGILQVWSLDTNKETARVETPLWFNTICFSPSGTILAAATAREVQLYDVAGRQLHRR